MSDLRITQKEAEKFLKEEKYRVDDMEYVFPKTGGMLHISLKTKTQETDFMLDIRQGKIALNKNTFQARVRKEIILARLDLGGPPHRNPDGAEILCPHLHLYQDGFGDRWAYPLPEHFTNANDFWLTLDEFMSYCNIVEKPFIRGK